MSLNWPLNKELPKGAYSSDLQNIVDSHGLQKREQLSRQLRNYKSEKYGLSQIKLLLKEGELEEMIRNGLSMTSSAFVADTLSKVLSRSSSSTDFNNFSRVLDAEGFPSQMASSLLKLTASSPKSKCHELLNELIDGWIQHATKVFPRTMTGLSKAELSFQNGKIAQKRSFIKEWMKQYESVGLRDEIMSRVQFGCLGAFLHNILFMNWAYCGVDCDRPAVAFPEKCLVGKYARGVIYYVAGWTLYKMSKALTIGTMQKELYFTFARG